MLALAALVQPVSAGVPSPKSSSKHCDRVVAALVSAIAVEGANVEKLTVAAIREEPGCACELAEAALHALPHKDGKPDVTRIIALTKTVVEAIFREIPEARPYVNCIVLAAVDALTPYRPDYKGGKAVQSGEPDPRAVAQLLAALLPLFLEFAPELIDSLIASILELAPGAAPFISQVLAGALSAFDAGVPLRRDPSAIEPNLQEPPAQEPPASPLN